MTDDTARRLANAILGVAAVAGAYYVLRTPPLRRTAWLLARTALTTTIPTWFARELQQAWTESAQHPSTNAHERDAMMAP